MQTLLEREVSSTQAKEHSPHSLKQPAPEGPAALPAHILAVGEHYRIANSEWWIGYGQGAYEEVFHLQGIIIYNRNTHIFLKLEEITQASSLLPELIQHGRVLIEQQQDGHFSWGNS